MSTDLWGVPRRQVLVVLTGGSLLALWIVWGGYTTKDAEGMLACALAGGIGVAFAAPFWALFRGRLPIWIALLLVIVALLGVMEFNAWAVETAQDHTVQSHFYEHWYFLLFSIPGLASLFFDRWQRRPHAQSHQTGNPPFPPPA